MEKFSDVILISCDPPPPTPPRLHDLFFTSSRSTLSLELHEGLPTLLPHFCGDSYHLDPYRVPATSRTIKRTRSTEEGVKNSRHNNKPNEHTNEQEKPFFFLEEQDTKRGRWVGLAGLGWLVGWSRLLFPVVVLVGGQAR